MVQDCVFSPSSELQFGVSEFRPKSDQSFVQTFLRVSELSSNLHLFGVFEVSELSPNKPLLSPNYFTQSWTRLSLCGQRRLWSDLADAQADLSLRWAHTHFVRFVMSRLHYISKLSPGDSHCYCFTGLLSTGYWLKTMGMLNKYQGKYCYNLNSQKLQNNTLDIYM